MPDCAFRQERLRELGIGEEELKTGPAARAAAAAAARRLSIELENAERSSTSSSTSGGGGQGAQPGSSGVREGHGAGDGAGAGSAGGGGAGGGGPVLSRSGSFGGIEGGGASTPVLLGSLSLSKGARARLARRALFSRLAPPPASASPLSSRPHPSA